MAEPQDLEIGVMFWAGQDPVSTIRSIKDLGVRCGQLGLRDGYPLETMGASWKSALAEEHFRIVTVFCSYAGESYADIATIQQTVGFVPPATRHERELRTLAVSDFAAEVGIGSVACHLGAVPDAEGDPEFQAVRNLVRRVCDHTAKYSQTFALETGQEPAPVLLKFLREVDRRNLGINFDPANMILYGTGDPIAALSVLSPHILSVHCKDGCWPPKDVPGALGLERPLGQGAVGIKTFIDKLKQLGYVGVLNIERQQIDPDQHRADVRMGIELLQGLLASA